MARTNPIPEKERIFVNDWLERINLGIKYKQKFSDCKEWPKWRSWYRNEFDEDGNCADYSVNRIFSYIKSMIPRIYFRTPSICVTAARPEYAAHARVVEGLDNWMVRETKVKKALKSAILDACQTGIGSLKLGYDSEFGFAMEQAIGENKSTVTQVGVKDGDRVEYNSNIQPGMPWVSAVRPDDIITPWGYTDPESLPWIAHAIIRPVEDVKQDQKYYQNARLSLKGGFSISEDKTRSNSLWKDGDSNNYCLLWEIRDFKRKRMIVICEDRILLECEDTLQIDGSNYEFIIFNEDRERFWPISDIKQLAPQQIEMNETRQYARKARKQMLLKFLYQKGAITQDNLDLLLSSDIEDASAGVEVNTENILSAVHVLQPTTSLTDALIREFQQLDADMREVMGFSQNQMGEFVPFHNKTKGEADIVDESSNLRSDERRDVVADVLSNVVRKFNQYVFTFWDKPRVMEIVGLDGLQYWVEYTGQQLKSEYLLVINPETGQPVSRALRQQVAQNMFAMFNQDPLIDQFGLRRLVMQQTDLIDPGYQNLVRMDPNMAMQPQAQPNQMGITSEQPVNVQDLQKDTSLRKQVIGR